jgi:hypothetical protein
MIPSMVNLWASNWQAYGSPGEPFPLIDVLQEQAKHWYRYPLECLAELPSNRYLMVEFEKFVDNPKKEIERIYKQFGFEISADYLKILEEETNKAKNYNSGNNYSLSEMGLNKKELIQEYQPIFDSLNKNLPK